MDNTLYHLTQRCLETVRETSKVELIVVDNGSTLGQHMMMEYADVYIRNQKNLGFTRAINQGVMLATKEYLVIGNNDYFVEKGWEETLIDVLKNNPKYMTITPYTGGKKPEGVKSDIWECFLPGSWYMIRKENFIHYGLYDEQFKNIFSDSDMAKKFYAVGYFMGETDRTKAEHYGSATINKCHDNDTEYKETLAKFLNKWGVNG